ncbi:TetR/AcrR family transcriptional regulator [Arthrobacter silvisoli]|uniref:TetR/AcrR family transcriptional regulator n=1 Tax=Arthrobacter silvisoli TaxID=2291022 RepID=UPI000E20CD72|nr:TetR/AcrR family transcriptional regulator [Arthrobacter silvisoli]
MAISYPVPVAAAGSKSGAASPDAGQRILDAAYELFSRRGIRDVGISELIERSGVAKATFYRHYRSKDELALAFLARRDQLWTVDHILAGARSRGSTPTQQLLAIFDVFGDWFSRDDFEACSFINVLLEMGPGHPLGQASIDYLARIREHVQALAEEAGLARPGEFARSWHILMKGSIISAAEGDTHAAARAREMAAWLIEHHQR